MFLSIVLACLSPSVLSCNIFTNVQDIFPSREECLVDAVKVRDSFIDKGAYAKAGCVKLEHKGIDT